MNEQHYIPTQSLTIKVSCAQGSIAGKKKHNEDAIGIRAPEGALLTHKGILAAIADGVSAAEAGREASEACIKSLLYDYFCTPEIWTVQKSILTVLNALNRWLYSQGTHFDEEAKGFISTLSLLVIKSTIAHLFHVGDSRIYRFRQGELQQLSQDHSRKVGDVTYLARAMGLDSKLQVDYQAQDILEGDIFLLSTDGVHDFLTINEMKDILLLSDSLDEKVQHLFQTALKNGSADNLSAQLIHVDNIPEANKEEFYQTLLQLPIPPIFNKGDQVDGLLIERMLYESARSQLYLVREIATQECYVMKTPSINFEDDVAYIERFTMESWLGRKIRHSKIVQVIKAKTSPSYMYYLMEYIDGVSLEEWMKKNPNPPLDKIVRLARQISLGLRVLHRNQIIHQDLKPSNIIIDENEQIKLLDYGSCHVLALNETSISVLDNSQLGTASYSAPESHHGEKLDFRSDQFSLAVIIYEMISGKLPFAGKLEQGFRKKSWVPLKYKKLVEYSPFIPPWFDNTIEKALSIKVDDRFDDIDEFIYHLEHATPVTLVNKNLTGLACFPVWAWQLLVLLQTIAIIFLCWNRK